jgi:hypothetical protein
MPVCGTLVQPSKDTNTPVYVDAAAEAVALQILREMDVPRRPKFTPSQLAQDVGGKARSWQRACQLGEIDAVHLPGGWVVTWHGLVRFFARRQNQVEMN